MQQLRLHILQALLRSLRFGQSRTKPVKWRRPPGHISPTCSSMGKNDPSARRPTTTLPTPMIRRSPLAVTLYVSVMLLRYGACLRRGTL